ncbi:MAG: hypothetical protein L3J82_10960 [Planctomycetes bacterium]|nr:hypothetical protein [Planctomycetota bacterium]
MKVVKIEQTQDGRWAVISESIEGDRTVIKAYDSLAEAKNAGNPKLAVKE